MPPPGDTARIPLGALDAVSFDLETTGLDPKHDRVIECAAVRIRLGRIDELETFQTLVNPERSIPTRSTSIHGLTDQDVADAMGFRQMIHNFAKWAGPTVFIGYGSDFDMAVLAKEHERLGLLWTPCMVLDVLPLIPSAQLNLSNFGLETVAKSLGIEVLGRHRALSDAIMTAHIFTALIPQWKKAGITTLAEAHYASSRNPQLKNHRLTTKSFPINGGGMSSFPYRHRVQDVMSSPPITVSAQETLAASITKMTQRGVSALIVRFPDIKQMGMITVRDILAAISRHGESSLIRSVDQFCSRQLLTIPAREFVYRSTVMMNSHAIHHLGVVNEDDILVGVITASDLMRVQGQNATSLGSSIDTAQSSQELARIWSDLSIVVRALARQSVDAKNISAIISRELRAMTKRACELSEQELGAPPCDYSMLVLGSGGRGESLLAMDQDHAIVMADTTADRDIDAYFAELGQRASIILDDAGIRLCDGGVMASNPKWRRGLTDWHQTLQEWLTRTSTQNILNADIFFDQMYVHGNSELARTLYRTALEDAQKSRTFLTLLAKRACEFDSPIGLFGRWRRDQQGRIDLKRNGILPIFSAARAIALEHGISRRSTWRRLTTFKAQRPDMAEICDDLAAAHGVILGTILNQQLRDIDQGLPLSSRIDPSDLNPLETQQLKWALGRVPQVTALLGVPAL